MNAVDLSTLAIQRLVPSPDYVAGFSAIYLKRPGAE